MVHGYINPKLEKDSSENSSATGLQKGGVDTNVAGPSESNEHLLNKLEIDQSIETTKLKTNNANAETFEFENNNIIKTIIQDKKSEKNYQCKYCSETFDKHQALGGHMNGHTRDERNLEKFEKVKTWIFATYPPPFNTTLASEAKLQGTPTCGATCNSYNHLVENGNVYNQLGEQWTNQQSTQQIQYSQEFQLQQLQNSHTQELQHYQHSQGLQNNQVPKSHQSTQVLQSPQNYKAPQRFQNYQTPQGLLNHQASQGSQNLQSLQQFQNYQTPQEHEYYQALQGSQNYQPSQGPQYHQTLQRFQNYQALQSPQSYQTPQGSQNCQVPQRPQSYQTPQGSQNCQVPQGPQSYQTPQGSQNCQVPQGPQSYQTPQGSQSYQAPQGSQNCQVPQGPQSYQTPQGSQNCQVPQGPQSYQTPQGSQSYQAPQGSQSYQAPQGSQSYQAPQGQWQQLVAHANNQQNINLNSKISNKPRSFDKILVEEQKTIPSNFQGLHFQKEVQGPQRYMPNPHNLHNGNCLTTGIFINEQLNKEYYGQLGSNMLERSNQMISILPTSDAIVPYKPKKPHNTSSSFNQSKDE